MTGALGAVLAVLNLCAAFLVVVAVPAVLIPRWRRRRARRP